MKGLKDFLLEKISSSLFELSWEYCNCKESLVCEDQEPQGPRYCWEIIEAAITETEFKV